VIFSMNKFASGLRDGCATFIACLIGSMTVAAPNLFSASGADWRDYLGGPDRNHYSTLKQITTANVGQLRRAWEFHTGDIGEMQCNPIVVQGTLYGITAANGVFALDAATGRELWRHYPTGNRGNRIVRGLVYWAEGDDQRLLFASESWLCAIDARTGKPIASFGVEGRTSLKAGLGETAQHKHVISTTPGAVFGDLIVMPLRLSESAEAAPGNIQAFNVRTGGLVWAFRTIPLPGEPGYETWSKDSHRNVNVGGANCWAGMAVDHARGLIFAPTGSAAPDFWGGDRKGANLYANCLLALDARTGKLRWHYQFVHHDLWDRDFPSPPNLVTVRRGGRTIDAVAQTTKSGHVLVFNRESGESLFPIDVVPVPKSTLASEGEETAATQPVPRAPAAFSRQTLTDKDLNMHASNYEALLAKFRGARTGAFEPFGRHDTVLFPGFDGGAEWGGAAADPDGVLYVNANEMAWIAKLRESPRIGDLAELSPGNRVYSIYCVGCHGGERKGNPAGGVPSMVDLQTRKQRDEVMQLITTGKGMMPGFPGMAAQDKQVLVDFLLGAEKIEGEARPVAAARSPIVRTPYRLDGYVRFLDADGYPAISPPWGSLIAIDLNTGEHRWRVTLGEFKALTAKGIPPTGTENYGGPVVTAGGLLFIAATKDATLRAFECKTGKLLWQGELPANGFATPATYEAGGKQFVVIAAGGSKLGTPKGDSYVAFALP
jgi:quinoprotein glucose dehydrogenase